MACECSHGLAGVLVSILQGPRRRVQCPLVNQLPGWQHSGECNRMSCGDNLQGSLCVCPACKQGEGPGLDGGGLGASLGAAVSRKLERPRGRLEGSLGEDACAADLSPQGSGDLLLGARAPDWSQEEAALAQGTVTVRPSQAGHALLLLSYQSTWVKLAGRVAQ